MNKDIKLDEVTESAVSNILSGKSVASDGGPSKQVKALLDEKTIDALTSILGRSKKEESVSQKSIVEQTGTFKWLEATISNALVSMKVPQTDWDSIKDAIFSSALAGKLGDGSVSDETAQAIIDIVTQLSKPSAVAVPTAQPEPEVVSGEDVGVGGDVEFETDVEPVEEPSEEPEDLGGMEEPLEEPEDLGDEGFGFDDLEEPGDALDDFLAGFDSEDGEEPDEIEEPEDGEEPEEPEDFDFDLVPDFDAEEFEDEAGEEEIPEEPEDEPEEEKKGKKSKKSKKETVEVLRNDSVIESTIDLMIKEGF